MARCSTTSCRRSCGKPRRWRSSTSSTRSPFPPSYKVRLTGCARPVAKFAPRLQPRLEKWLWRAVGPAGAATSDLQGPQRLAPPDPGVSEEMTPPHAPASSGGHIWNGQHSPGPPGRWDGRVNSEPVTPALVNCQRPSCHLGRQTRVHASALPAHPEELGFLVSSYLLFRWLCQ